MKHRMSLSVYSSFTLIFSSSPSSRSNFFFVRYKPLLLFINCAIYLLFCLNIKKHKLTYNHSDLYVHSTFNERGRESEKHMQEIISILHTTVISAILPIILLLVFFIFMWKVQRIDYIVFRNTFLFHFDI